MNKEIDIKYEIYRKLIHVFSTIIPVLYFLTSKEFIVTLVGTGTVLMVLIDLLKRYSRPVGSLYKMVFVRILREDEREFGKKLFTGGTYYAFGILLSIVFFTMEIAAAAILIMIWSDTLAALAGRIFGKIKIYHNKTLEGSMTFFASGVLILLILSVTLGDFPSLLLASAALFITTLAELFLDKLNDNLTIPLVFGFTLTILIKLL